MEKFIFVLMQSNKNSKYLWGNMEKKFARDDKKFHGGHPSKY